MFQGNKAPTNDQIKRDTDIGHFDPLLADLAL